MIQIDMPMPDNCISCYFARADYIEGVVTLFCMTPIGRKMYAPDLINRISRPEWCPLKEQETETEWCDRCGRVRLKSGRCVNDKGRGGEQDV